MARPLLCAHGQSHYHLLLEKPEAIEEGMLKALRRG